MGAVVLELQRDALDKGVKVADLLRKALVVARKLKQDEFKDWIESELSGYEGKVPDYRMVQGTPRAWNPYRGWVPVIFEDSETAEAISKRASGQSIGELEDLLGRDSSGSLHMPFPHHLQRQLSKGFGYDTEVSLFVERASLVGILEAVRNIVLNWALKLEEEGILGEGLSFSASEKERASAGAIGQNVTNFYGPVQSPQVAQGSQHVVQVSASFQFDAQMLTQFLSSLTENLNGLALQPDQQAEVVSEVETLRAQLKSPAPKKSIIRESVESVKRILEGAGGGVAAQLLLELGKAVM